MIRSQAPSAFEPTELVFDGQESGRKGPDFGQRGARAGALSSELFESTKALSAVARFLLLYSSVYGCSRQICERIQSLLQQAGQAVTVAALTDKELDLAAFDVIVIGASIKHGKHNPTVISFIRQHQALLASKPSALFSVNLVARKPGKNTPQTNPYLKRLVAESPWKPSLLGVFAGELDYSRYGPIDKHMMRLVMWINQGPTDLNAKVQFTNWQDVERFAAQVAALAAPATGSMAAA
ncbi:MAG: menaquinone-dependent protoporphyrinogen IX dehydrogenase [Burkholderiaceae bacterium]